LHHFTALDMELAWVGDTRLNPLRDRKVPANTAENPLVKLYRGVCRAMECRGALQRAEFLSGKWSSRI
jgi:hypothetical protein